MGRKGQGYRCTVNVGCAVNAIYDVGSATVVAVGERLYPGLSAEARRLIAEAAVDIADGRGTSRSTIGWNKQRALAEKVLSQIYVAGWNDASRSS